MHRRRLLKLILAILVIAAIFGAWQILWPDSTRTAFLQRFQQSFESSDVKLVGTPRIEPVERLNSFRDRTFRVFSLGRIIPSINYYTITASFTKDGETKWGRWSYTCNNARGDDAIYRFGYAEASDEAKLADYSFWTMRYVHLASGMIDGIPSTGGPMATVNSPPTSWSVTKPFVLNASSDAGTVCSIQTFSPNLFLKSPGKQKPDATGKMQWNATLNPKHVGSSVQIHVICKQDSNGRQFVSTTRLPNLDILP